jgi:hypothetical protein
MAELSAQKISDYRSVTFRTRSNLVLRNPEQAVDFVNERGFIYFWPNKDYLLPSLWNAVAGDRPVPKEHDDPGNITWGWKDEMLGKQRWYYARLVRKRNTILSLADSPFFYALSPNYGDFENDYVDQYEMGVLTMEAKNVYEALLREGPLDTLALRKTARMASQESDTRFSKAIETLQVEMKILPIGIAEVGAWKYAFIYDIAARHFPQLDAQARQISEEEARHHLVRRYIRSLGAAPEKEIHRLFGWRPVDCQRAIDDCIQAGEMVKGLPFPGSIDAWMAVPELIV